MIDPVVLAVGCLVFVAVVLVALLIYAALSFEAERRAHRAHVERLERMLASKNMGEFAATEAILARPPEKPQPEKPQARLYDDAWTVPPKENM